MKYTEIRKILKLAQEFNVKTLKIDNFECEFLSAPSWPHVKETKASAPSATAIEGLELSTERMPTDDEMLMWSSPAYDEITALRKAE